MNTNATTPDPVLRHLLATAGLMNAAIDAFSKQCGEDSRHLLLTALRSGSMMRATTTISLAGAMGITFDIVTPQGEVLNVGRVDFDGDQPTLN